MKFKKFTYKNSQLSVEEIYINSDQIVAFTPYEIDKGKTYIFCEQKTWVVEHSIDEVVKILNK